MFRLLAFSLLAFLFVLQGQTQAQANIQKYKAGDIELRYTMTRPLNSVDKSLPVWIYQQGDGDIRSPFMPFLSGAAAQMISQLYGVVFIWPELRREYYYKNLKAYCELDFLHRVNDLNDLIESVKNLKNVDHSRIFLVGHSAGAEVVTLTAHSRRDIRGVVTLGGGVIQYADYLKRTSEDTWVDKAQTNLCQEGQFEKRSGAFWHQFLYSNLYNEIKSSPQPYLALMGGADRVSQPSVQRVELEQLKKEKSNFDYAIVENSTHSFANLKAWNIVHQWTVRVSTQVLSF